MTGIIEPRDKAVFTDIEHFPERFLNLPNAELLPHGPFQIHIIAPVDSHAMRSVLEEIDLSWSRIVHDAQEDSKSTILK